MTNDDGRGTAFALIGAQWGSEGKGVIAHHLADHFAGAIRVGGPNAGHSFYEKGTLYVARSVPCIWTNPDAHLMIGAGAVINPHVLIEELAGLPFKRTVYVDPVATMITEDMEHAELGTIREKIGSTAEGVGEARVARMRRNGEAVTAADYDWPADSGVFVADVSRMAQTQLLLGGSIMLEGTQGSGLSLFHGSQYPYATSTDTNASGLASEAGIAPSDVGHVQLVARTFPIRVAGNSGPMGDELSWDWFVEQGIVEKPEKTTVTKKVRRISRWYDPVVDKAVALNRPCGIWLTFGDYLDPSKRGAWVVTDSRPIMEFVEYIEDRYAVPVMGVGTGPGVEDDDGTPQFVTARLAGKCAHGVSW